MALLVFAAIELYLAVKRGSLLSEGADVVAASILGFASLSIGASARRTGLKYLRGEKAMARDVGRLVARWIGRRNRGANP